MIIRNTLEDTPKPPILGDFQMKKAILCSIILATTAAFAAADKIIVVKNAVLNICLTSHSGEPLAPGCRDTLQFASGFGDIKKSMFFDLDATASKEVENCFNSVIGTHRFHQIRITPSFTVKGYITIETGLFPNTSIELKIFHIVDSKNICSVPLPR